MPTCQVCFKHFKNLTSHINAKHSLNKDQYLGLFPGEKIVDDELSKVFADRSRQLHKKLKREDFQAYYATRVNTCKKMRDIKGDEFRHSEKTKKKMSLSHTGKSRNPHTEKTKEKLSRAKRGKPILLSDAAKKSKSEKQSRRWRERKENVKEYSQYISQLSLQRKNYILLHGNAVPKKGKKTSVEKRFEDFLNKKNIVDYNFQYFLCGKYYDFFIPSMNMLIEVDGEYWHRFPSAIKNDIEKHIIANDSNLRILRITEKCWQPELIFEQNYSKIQEHNYAILNKRTTECLNYELSISLI